MSSTPSHFAQGYILSALLCLSWPICIVGGLISAGMDYDVWKESIIRALAAKKAGDPDWWKRRNWRLYVPSHKFRVEYLILPILLNLIPIVYGLWSQIYTPSFLVALHWIIDFLTHKKSPVGGWKPWAKYLEIALWLLMGWWVIA